MCNGQRSCLTAARAGTPPKQRQRWEQAGGSSDPGHAQPRPCTAGRHIRIRQYGSAIPSSMAQRRTLLTVRHPRCLLFLLLSHGPQAAKARPVCDLKCGRAMTHITVLSKRPATQEAVETASMSCSTPQTPTSLCSRCAGSSRTSRWSCMTPVLAPGMPCNFRTADD